MSLCRKIVVNSRGVKSLKPLYPEAKREVPKFYFEVLPLFNPFLPLAPLPKQEYVWQDYIGRLPIVFLKMIGAKIDHKVYCVVNKFTLIGTLVGESIGSLSPFLVGRALPPLVRLGSPRALHGGGAGPLVRWGGVDAAPDRQ